MAVGHMKQGNVIDLTEELSLSAAKISIKYNCILWTQDQHFSELYSVNYFEKLS